MPLLSPSKAIYATTPDGAYVPELAKLRGRDVSGVYAIFAEGTARRVGELLYVGESHTGRLYDTITRHFRSWRRSDSDPHGGRRGGTTYDRNRVKVAWIECPADTAQAAQYKEIQDTQPRDNQPDGSTAYAEQNPPKQLRYEVRQYNGKAETSLTQSRHRDYRSAEAAARESKRFYGGVWIVFDTVAGCEVTAPTAPHMNPPRSRKPNTARAAGRAGTPGGRAARRIVAHQLGTPVAIVYRHAADGKLYRHSFSAKTPARLAHAQIGGPVLVITNTRTTKRNGARFIA